MKRGSLFGLAVTSVLSVACQTTSAPARDASATSMTVDVAPTSVVAEGTTWSSEAAVATPGPTEPAAPSGERVMAMSGPAPNAQAAEAVIAAQAAAPPAAPATPAAVIPASTVSPVAGPRTTSDGRPAPGNVMTRSGGPRRRAAE